MSRIGKKVIAIPKGVKVEVKSGAVDVQGPKGKLSQALPKGIGFEVEGDQLYARTLSDDPELGKFHGLARSLVANAVRGVTEGFKVLEPAAGERVQSELRVQLKYGPRGERVITGIERVSRPGRRVYFGRDDVPEVLAGLGTSILTTSRGVMTGREAVKAGVGGEVLCNIW